MLGVVASQPTGGVSGEWIFPLHYHARSAWRLATSAQSGVENLRARGSLIAMPKMLGAACVFMLLFPGVRASSDFHVTCYCIAR
jgi:hypothetical protein